MSYDPTKPNSSDQISSSDDYIRENFRAIKDDKIVNALSLNGHLDSDFLLKDGSINPESLLAYSTVPTMTDTNGIPCYKNIKDYIGTQALLKKDGSVSPTSILSYSAAIIPTDYSIPCYKNVTDLAATKYSSTDATITKQGESFNAPSKLLKTNSSGQYPAMDGSLITNLADLTTSNLVTYAVNYGAVNDLGISNLILGKNSNTLKFGKNVEDINNYTYERIGTVGSNTGCFGNNGYYFYYADFMSSIIRYTLATPYDLSSSTGSISMSTGIYTMYGLSVSPDGLSYHSFVSTAVNGIGTNRYFLYQWNVATPWALPATGTPTYSLETTATIGYFSNHLISKDGKSFYIFMNGSIIRYPLTTVSRVTTMNQALGESFTGDMSWTTGGLNESEKEIYYVNSSKVLKKVILKSPNNLAGATVVSGATLANTGSVFLSPDGILVCYKSRYVASTTIPTLITFPNSKTYCVSNIADLTISQSGSILIKESDLTLTGGSATVGGKSYPTYSGVATFDPNPIIESIYEPEPSSGAKYYLDISVKPKVPRYSNNYDWTTVVQFVKLGYVTYSSGITDIITYAYNGKYISPILYGKAMSALAFSDNLGTQDKIIKVFSRYDSTYEWTNQERWNNGTYYGFAVIIGSDNVSILSSVGGYTGHAATHGYDSFAYRNCTYCDVFIEVERIFND